MGTVQIESNVLHYWRKEINTSKIKHYTLKTKVYIWQKFLCELAFETLVYDYTWMLYSVQISPFSIRYPTVLCISHGHAIFGWFESGMEVQQTVSKTRRESPRTGDKTLILCPGDRKADFKVMNLKVHWAQ